MIKFKKLTPRSVRRKQFEEARKNAPEKISGLAIKYTSDKINRIIAFAEDYADIEINHIIESTRKNIRHEIFKATKGFITNKSRFLEAEEAMKIAKEQGQLLNPEDENSTKLEPHMIETTIGTRTYNLQ